MTSLNSNESPMHARHFSSSRQGAGFGLVYVFA